MKFFAKMMCLVALLALANSSPRAMAELGQGAGSSGIEDWEGGRPDSVHERRMAQLRRLQYLAVENERRDLLSRVDGLIARELKRHSRQEKGPPEKEDVSEHKEDDDSPETHETVSDEELEAEVEAMERAAGPEPKNDE